MTKKELIEILKDVPDDADIFLDDTNLIYSFAQEYLEDNNDYFLMIAQI